MSGPAQRPLGVWGRSRGPPAVSCCCNGGSRCGALWRIWPPLLLSICARDWVMTGLRNAALSHSCHRAGLCVCSRTTRSLWRGWLVWGVVQCGGAGPGGDGRGFPLALSRLRDDACVACAVVRCPTGGDRGPLRKAQRGVARPAVGAHMGTRWWLNTGVVPLGKAAGRWRLVLVVSHRVTPPAAAAADGALRWGDFVICVLHGAAGGDRGG